MASHLTKASSCDSGTRRSAHDAEDKDSTRDWLETILESYHTDKTSDHCPDIEVLEWQIGALGGSTEDIAGGAGGDVSPPSAETSLMELLAVHARYSVCGAVTSLHMVAKLLPHESMTRAFIKEWALDKREICFYTEVLPALESVCPGLPIPICYHASYKETAESVLVLEDMTSKGFNPEALTRGLSLSQAASALRALAKIHAASVVYTVKQKVNMREKFPYLLTADQASASFHSLVKRGLPLLIKFLQNKPEHKAIREKLQDYQSDEKISGVMFKAFKPSNKLNTLVHCDFWVNNLLFGGQDEGTMCCCIIDWQLVTYGSPSIDLALLLTTSLTPDVRRDSRQTLISIYFTEFKSHLNTFGCDGNIKDYGFGDLEEDVRTAEAMAGLVMVGSVDLALGVPEREERVLSILKDYFEGSIL